MPVHLASRVTLLALLALGASDCLNWSRFHRADDADACAAPAATDDCASIPALSALPLIDGVLECGVQMQRFTADQYRANAGPMPAGVNASFAVAWRPDGLYVFAQLEGSNNDPPLASESPWCGDDLEIFVDHDGQYSNPPNYDVNDTTQFVIPAPDVGATAGTRADVYSQRGFIRAWPLSEWVSRRAGNTVTFEAFVTAQDLSLGMPWNAMAAQTVGFDIAMSLGTGQPPDGGSCHHTLGHFLLRRIAGDAACTHPSCSTVAFCAPTLAP